MVEVAIVTGSNQGCGYETAMQLAAQKCTVVLACRNTQRGLKAQEAIGNGSVFMQCDLVTLASVRQSRGRVHRNDVVLSGCLFLFTPLFWPWVLSGHLRVCTHRPEATHGRRLRRPATCAEAQGGCTPMPFHRFASDFTSRFDRLDFLINNAAVMSCPKEHTEDGFELQMATNHFGARRPRSQNRRLEPYSFAVPSEGFDTDP